MYSQGQRLQGSPSLAPASSEPWQEDWCHTLQTPNASPRCEPDVTACPRIGVGVMLD